jgi:uncharacterized integral membrane protein (TIGR02327 family)
MIETVSQAISYMIVLLMCILLTWWALQAFRFDIFLREPKSFKARMLQLIIAVVIGYNLARFLMDYAHFASLLKWVV